MTAGKKFKIKGFEDHPPYEDHTGQTWEEGGWPGRTNGSKVFLVIGAAGRSVLLLDLETGAPDSVHWTAFIEPAKGWRRLA